MTFYFDIDEQGRVRTDAPSDVAVPLITEFSRSAAMGGKGGDIKPMTIGFGRHAGKPLFNEEGRTPGAQQVYETWNPKGVREAMARENRVATETPFGRSHWEQDEQGNWTLKSEMSPELEGMYDMASRIATGEADTEFEQRAMKRAKAMLEPQFAAERERFEANMQARGIPMGSDIYQRELENLRRSQAQGWQDAAFNAMLAGEQMQTADYQMLANMMAGMPMSPFTQLDVVGSYQPYLTGSSMAAANRATRQQARDARQGQYIGAGTDLVSSILDFNKPPGSTNFIF